MQHITVVYNRSNGFTFASTITPNKIERDVEAAAKEFAQKVSDSHMTLICHSVAIDSDRVVFSGFVKQEV